MAITATYLNYALAPGTSPANRPAGAYLRYICDTEADLPSVDVIDGDRAFTEDSDRRWLRVTGAWVLQTNEVVAASALITTSQQNALPIGAIADGQFLKRVGADVVGAAGGGGAAAWGDISGTLSAQTDLQAALDGKQAAGTYATGGGTATGANTGDQTSVSGNAGTATALQTPRTINGVSFNGTANITIGSAAPARVTFTAPVLAATVWTNMPAALSFLLSTATVGKDIQKIDLTAYTQCRLLVNKQGTAAPSGAKLILRYRTAFNQVVANYSDIGTSEVSVAINAQNVFLDTGWIDLAAGAKADVFVSVLGSGGDGVLDPAFGAIVAEFK